MSRDQETYTHAVSIYCGVAENVYNILTILPARDRLALAEDTPWRQGIRGGPASKALDMTTQQMPGMTSIAGSVVIASSVRGPVTSVHTVETANNMAINAKTANWPAMGLHHNILWCKHPVDLHIALFARSDGTCPPKKSLDKRRPASYNAALRWRDERGVGVAPRAAGTSCQTTNFCGSRCLLAVAGRKRLYYSQFTYRRSPVLANIGK